MKRIISGKIYDTETAEVVACGDNGVEYGDCWLRTEQLYKTPRGNYFIYDQTPNIYPLNDKFNYGHEEYRQNIIQWIETWNVTNLVEPELKLFNITNA